MGLKPLTVQTSTGLARNFSASGLKSSILIDTRFRKPENTLVRKHNGSETLEDEKDKDGASGHFTTLQDGAPGAETSSSGKIQVPTSEKDEEKKTRKVSMEKIEFKSQGRIEEKKNKSRASSVESIEVKSKERIKQKNARECDVTKGKWVYDETYPLYTDSSCPYIDEGFDCAGNGRLDKNYMKWRWQPQDCDIPRY